VQIVGDRNVFAQRVFHLRLRVLDGLGPVETGGMAHARRFCSTSRLGNQILS
jgi:hypothetical protein